MAGDQSNPLGKKRFRGFFFHQSVQPKAVRPAGFEPATKGFKEARRFPTGLDYLTLWSFFALLKSKNPRGRALIGHYL